MKLLTWIICLMPALLLAQPKEVLKEKVLTKELETAGIIERLGDTVDVHNLKFKNEEGTLLPLSTYFSGNKPVVMVLAYYTCPSLCGYLLNGTSNSLRTLNWSIGEQFEVVTLSINPKEGPDLAAGKKAAYIEKYGRLGAEKGWHFLTGTEDQIKKVAAQLGFGYYFDEKTKEFAHSAGIFILTPQGKISRVLYGIDFPNRDLKLSLLEASNGQVGTIFERFLMFCYKYDATSKSYSFLIRRVVQASSLFLILFMGIYLLVLFRSERKLGV